MVNLPILIPGDCRDAMAAFAMAGEQFDAVVCDPPYELTSTVKRFGKPGSAPAKSNGATGVYGRAARGFLGKLWDGTGIAFDPDTWRLAFDCLKPGGHLLAFGGTRTSHRMVCAIEDAGFEVRDSVYWIYGTGFPKSHDVSKGVDKAAGAVREVISARNAVKRMIPGADQHATGTWLKDNGRMYTPSETAPATIEAEYWQGWGTALKPSVEPIVLARKPLIGTVVQNVLAHGTGGLNIDACRIPGEKPLVRVIDHEKRDRPILQTKSGSNTGEITTEGRWPANLVHDGSAEVMAHFPQTSSGGAPTVGDRNGEVYGTFAERSLTNHGANSGSAARFYYSAKASKRDRAGSKHPTIKPLALMRWLCTLVTPPGGRILDPFAGSGSTLQAAYECGFNAVGCEMDPEYQADILRRIGDIMPC